MLVVLGMIGCGVVGMLLHFRVMLAFVVGLAASAHLEKSQRPGRWEDMSTIATLIFAAAHSCFYEACQHELNTDVRTDDAVCCVGVSFSFSTRVLLAVRIKST